MRRVIIFSTLLLCGLSGNLLAQRSLPAVLSENKTMLSVGSGIYSGGFPISGFLDFPVHPDWTAGPQINFVFFNDFHFIVSGRADYHFNRLLQLSQPWDFYAGATLGLDFARRTSFSSGIHVGGRWYWDRTWGINLEIGAGTYFNSAIGISVRL
jgi:outer membrane immunogenic protein